QEMAEDDGAVGYAERAGGAYVLEIARPQEFGPDHADEGHPGKKQHDAEQDEEAGRQNGRDDENEIEHRDRRPDLDEALEQKVRPAAEIALHGAGRHADD